MDIAEANSEPFYRFHRFNEELNRTMRITVAGLAFVKQEASRNRTAGSRIQLPTDGEPWGKNVWNDPTPGVIPAKKFVSQMGVVRIVTALEDLCVGLKAEHDRYAQAKGALVKSDHHSQIDDEGISPPKLYAELSWNKGILQTVGPLYEYFSKVRNCVVHRSGRASKELNKYAGSSQLAQCVNTWQGPRQKRLPSLPTVSIGNDLPLLPRHAILASEICRRIAVDANKQLIDYLGMEGVAYMAAYHSLFSDSPMLTNARNSAQALLNTILTNRYRVKLEYREEAVQALGRLGKWKPYLRKFEKWERKAAPA